jgi:hypothetical protein
LLYGAQFFMRRSLHHQGRQGVFSMGGRFGQGRSLKEINRAVA